MSSCQRLCTLRSHRIRWTVRRFARRAQCRRPCHAVAPRQQELRGDPGWGPLRVPRALRLLPSRGAARRVRRRQDLTW